jgi:LysR family transcriptional regulator, cys regulon transcriptional activator
MKLQQLRYICEVARCGLNVTDAAANLYTSQPGISKQIRLLEEELGVQIFKRSGKHFADITPAGRAIIKRAGQVLLEVGNIKDVAQEFADESRGSLSIATTHTQACYALPPTIQRFRERYPDVTLHIHEGTPMQIAEMAARGEVNFAIATEALELLDDLVTLPCYHWNRCVIAPIGHPVLAQRPLTLKQLAAHPIITYVFGFTGRSKLDQAFAAEGLTPNVVFTVTDSTALKAYTRLNMGVGIMAKMAYDAKLDADLGMVDASHLFASSTSHIAFRRGALLRGYMYDFIHEFAPHLSRPLIDSANNLATKPERDRLFEGHLAQLPVK